MLSPPANRAHSHSCGEQDGILAAQVNFKELEDVDPSLINICVNGFAGGRAQHIRISPGAWSNVMTTLHRYEILDIVVESQVVPGTSIHSGEKGKEDPELPKYEDIHTVSCWLHDVHTEFDRDVPHFTAQRTTS